MFYVIRQYPDKAAELAVWLEQSSWARKEAYTVWCFPTLDDARAYIGGEGRHLILQVVECIDIVPAPPIKKVTEQGLIGKMPPNWTPPNQPKEVSCTTSYSKPKAPNKAPSPPATPPSRGWFSSVVIGLGRYVTRLGSS